MWLLDDAVGIGVLVGGAWALRRYVTAGDGALKAVIAEGERKRAKRAAAQAAKLACEQAALAEMRARGPVVQIATGTGKLIERNHASGIQAGSPVLIDAELAAYGLLVVGPSGSGKSRAVLQPFANSWLKSDPRAGLFAFGVKPNWSSILVRIARHAGRSPEAIHVVGPGGRPWPLLRGLSPDAVSDFMRTAMQLGNGGGDKFFQDSAANLVRRIASVLYAISRIGPVRIERDAQNGEVLEEYELRYDLRSIARMATMDGDFFTAEVMPELRAQGALLEARDPDAKRLLDANLPEVQRTLTMAADKQREGIQGSVDSVLAPFFVSQSFIDAFSNDEPFDLGVLDRGHVVIIDVNMNEFPGAAKLAYLLAFEQLRRHMQDRISRLESGETLNAIAFVADEYAQVAAKEHAEMFRISRESGIAPVVAYQVHTDYQAKIGREPADGIAYNFGTVIAFRTRDPATLRLVQAGKSEVLRTSKNAGGNISHGKNTGSNYGLNHGPSGSGSSGVSSGVSVQEGSSWGETEALHERSVVDEQLLSSLVSTIRRGVPVAEQTAEVVIATTMGERSVLDVCRVRAWDPPAAEARPEPTADPRLFG